MSALTNSLLSYGDSSAREDVVLNAIEILTARESQISNIIGVSRAIATVHNHLVDTLLTAASLAVEESVDYTMGAKTTPTRLTNLVEHIAAPFAVSRTQQAIEHYQGTNELARQTEKALNTIWRRSAWGLRPAMVG